MTTKAKLITSDDPKGRQATDLFRGAYNKAGLSDEKAQRLNENREGKFTDGLAKLIMECSATGLYANQVVVPNYTYPGKFQRKPEELQIKILAKELKLDPRMALDYLKKIKGRPSILPSGCHPEDGNFAIVSPFADLSMTATGLKDSFDLELNCKALLHLLKIISTKMHLVNYRNGRIDAYHLRQTERTLSAHRTLANEQGESPIWIIPAQLGFLHKGEPVSIAHKNFEGNEFGLGSVDGTSIAITHPERFNEFGMDLPGDKFSPGANGIFTECPCLSSDVGRLEFCTRVIIGPSDDFGSATGFLSQPI